MTRLETERLILRPPEPSDLDGYAPIFASPAVMRYIGDGTPLQREQVRERIEWMRAHWARYDVGLFSVLAKDDGRLVGRVGLLLWDAESWVSALRAEPRGHIETEIGWTIAPGDQRRGFATEAAVAVRDWAIVERKLRRLISLIHEGNDASIRVALKIGETLERTALPGFPARIDLYALHSH